MAAVFVGAFVSLAIASFAMAVVYSEFRRRWPQIAAALAFDDGVRPTLAPARLRRPAALRQAWPAPVRLQPLRRAAA